MNEKVNQANQNQESQKEILFRTKFSNRLNLTWVISYAIAAVVFLAIAAACFFGKLYVDNEALVQGMTIFSYAFVFGTILATCLTGLNLLVWLSTALGHKNAFCTEDGIYVAKKPYAGEFIEWSQIDKITCDGASRKRTYGLCNIHAKLPVPDHPEQIQEKKIQVSEIQYPDAFVDFAMPLVKASHDEPKE